MLCYSSLFAFFALLDPLFVPHYWNPESIVRIRFWGWFFDLESLIYCFTTGGIAFSIYKVLANKRIEKKTIYNQEKPIRRITLNLLGMLITLAVSYKIFGNWILSFISTLLVGALFITYHRTDLIKPMLFSGASYSLIHTLIIIVNDNLLVPGAIRHNWNVKQALGIFIYGVPLEELLFSLTFGMAVSVLYEYLLGYELKENNQALN